MQTSCGSPQNCLSCCLPPSLSQFSLIYIFFRWILSALFIFGQHISIPAPLCPPGMPCFFHHCCLGHTEGTCATPSTKEYCSGYLHTTAITVLSNSWLISNISRKKKNQNTWKRLNSYRGPARLDLHGWICVTANLGFRPWWYNARPVYSFSHYTSIRVPSNCLYKLRSNGMDPSLLTLGVLDGLGTHISAIPTSFPVTKSMFF